MLNRAGVSARARARRPRSPLAEAVAAIRLLALTGCRGSEVLKFRWRNIGGDALNLRTRRPALERCCSARQLGRMSRPFPALATPARSCFLGTPKAGARTAFERAGGRSTKTRSSEPSPARPSAHRQSGRDGRRESTAGRQAVRASSTPHHCGLRSPCRCAPGRSGGDGGEDYRRGDGAMAA